MTALIGWIAAAAAILLAVGSWTGSGGDDPNGARATRESDELRTLRLALSTSKAENAALRSELDRLIAGGAGAVARPAATEPSEAGQSEKPARDPAEQQELASKIGEAVTRAAELGDQNSNREAALALMEAFRQGPEGFGPMRDAFLATENPKAKSMLLPTLMFIGGEDARDLVIDQVHSATDPDLKKALMTLSVKYATPEHVGDLKDAYVEALRSEDTDPQTRRAAIRGLRYAKGDDIHETLLAAASDPSEEIRLAAIQNLATRPSLRDQVGELLSRESSDRVRQIGDCQLLVGGK